MHIPDGYLSPSTSIVMGAIAAPFLLRASNEVKKKIGDSSLPLISVFSALSFVIMMFNIPLPGGTSGHAVGTTIAAIVLGPRLAILSTTIALVIQAMFFGDGGILSLGANIVNMAIAMSLVGYGTYKLLTLTSENNRTVHIVAAAIAGYFAINTAALLTSIELGIQPLLFHTETGRAVYFPYPFSVSLPAMMIGHLTIAGFAEGLLTGLTLAWIARVQPQLLKKNLERHTISFSKKFVYGLLILLAIATPVGLLTPGTAWGEWGDQWSTLWNAPIPDYSFQGLIPEPIAYIGSAVLGIILTGIVASLLIKLMRWMYQRQPKQETSPNRVGSWLNKNITSITITITQAITASPAQNQTGLLQHLDARTKILGSVVLLFAISFTKHLWILIGLYLFVLLIAQRSHIKLWLFMKRIWLFLPFFTGIIVVPALLNIVTPGEPIFTIIHTETFLLTITVPGVIVGAFLLLRVATSVSITVLVLQTTPWNEILNGLTILGIPQPIIMMIAMTYRYSIIFLQTATSMLIARKSRTVGPTPNYQNRAYIGTITGILFTKSYTMSSEIYRAMRSRGYRGNIVTGYRHSFRLSDAMAISIILLIALFVFLNGAVR